VKDRFAAARAVADAVLYEGYVLYPYRASSAKNQLRWQFGVLTPRTYSEADGSERWSTRTECLMAPGPDPQLTVRIRCLQVQHRAVEAPGAGGVFVPAGALDVAGVRYVDWDEAVEQIVDLPPRPGPSGNSSCYEEAFRFAGGTETELIHDEAGAVAGRLVRRREVVEGCVRVETGTAPAGAPLVKVAVTVENRTEWEPSAIRRDQIMGQSLVAVHTMLAVDGGSFVSLLDPPEGAGPAVADCHSDGSFPVLIGTDDVVLSSPIILYDHPEVAPESPGDLYDSTEIDEILALRVLTLTDEEKSEARATDPRAAAIIDRCDDMPPEMWERLHGAVRALHPAVEPDLDAASLPAEPPSVEGVPWWDPAVDASFDPWSDVVVIGGVEVSKGTAVLLRPSRRSDAQDLFLRGMTATVAGVFSDVDGSELVAVTVDDDPATAELSWQGRYLFFHPDEVEPLSDQGAPR
jgi:hypothetical protein